MTEPTLSPLFQNALNATPTPEPDRVVGVEWRCTLLRLSDGRQLELKDTDACAPERTPTANGAFVDRRQLVTVRTYAGTTYVVAVAPDAKVALGQTWPPPQ